MKVDSSRNVKSFALYYEESIGLLDGWNYYFKMVFE